MWLYSHSKLLVSYFHLLSIWTRCDSNSPGLTCCTEISLKWLDLYDVAFQRLLLLASLSSVSRYREIVIQLFCINRIFNFVCGKRKWLTANRISLLIDSKSNLTLQEVVFIDDWTVLLKPISNTPAHFKLMLYF